MSPKPKSINEQVSELLTKALSAIKGRRKSVAFKNVAEAFKLLGGNVATPAENATVPEPTNETGDSYSGDCGGDDEDVVDEPIGIVLGA